MSIWLSGFEHRDLGPDGGPYDRHDNPKLLWHTWEGYSWSSAESAFAKYPPHIAVNPKDRVRRQYVSLDRHAYALAGSDTENSWVIQVEVAGAARDTHTWPAEWLRWLGTDVLAPILSAVPIPPAITPLGFHGEGEGIILASPRSPIRYRSVAAWDAFSGHVGHQHAPSPDAHWDPGRLDVQAIIEAANPTVPGPPPEEEEMFVFQAAGQGGPMLMCGGRIFPILSGEDVPVLCQVCKQSAPVPISALTFQHWG